MGGYASTLLRVVVGAIYLVQAYLAMFGATPKGLAGYLDKLHLPAPTLLAIAVIAVHGLGGAMLVIGMWTRLAGSLNAAVLLLGILVAYVREGTLLRASLVDTATGRTTGSGYEYIALLVAATVLVATGGGGSGGGGGGGGRKGK